MSTVSELKKVARVEPKDLGEWLDGFSEDDRETVVGAILRGATKDVYPIIASLSENPYPFRQATLNHHRRELRREVARG